MSLLQQLRPHWNRLAERERWLLRLVALLVVLTLVGALGVAPAVGVLKTAPQRMAQLDRELQSMESLAAQARDLQSRPVVQRGDALRTIQTSLQQRMGNLAQMSNAGDRITVTLTAVPPPVLAQWLAQARSAARVVVAQARLTRSPDGWSGSLVLQLPAE